MKFSVVIPLYNSENTIKACLESVFTQTRIDLVDEIVIIDDGSTDNSIKIIKEEFPGKYIKIISKKNGGAASARNIGIKFAKNRFIALLDSDDEWKPNKIEKQAMVLNEFPEIKALGSNRSGESIKAGKEIREGLFQLSPVQYCIKNWPCTPSLVFDKCVFNSDQYFPEEMRHAEEGLFFLYLSSSCGLYYVEDELVVCGNGKRAFGDWGLSGDVKAMHMGNLKMIKKAGEMKYIPKYLVSFLQMYENLKYIRRRLIVKM
jgi:glycosyltransferase involved in cell wall biosynthesis